MVVPFRRLTLSGVVCLVLISTAYATRPVKPVPAGYYSFDTASPTVTDGSVGATDVLFFPGMDAPVPGVAVPGSNLGVMDSNDISSLAATTNGFYESGCFFLIFSVDRQSVGGTPPELLLVDRGIPYNMMDQAQRGHAAADQFMSLTRFDRFGVIQEDTKGSMTLFNNTLLRNQFDEGGTSHGADPETSAEATSSTAQDNIDALAKSESSTGGGKKGLDMPGLYFTVRANKQEAAAGERGRSGADILYDPSPMEPGNPEVFVLASDLGLQVADTIDGLIVFDYNANGFFDMNDEILFSLDRSSPSLANLPSGSPASVYKTAFGSSAPTLFASAEQLGLSGPDDNIDALNLRKSDIEMGALDVATLHGIRQPVFGDYDHDADVDLSDYFLFAELCISGPIEGPLYMEPAQQCLLSFDANHDLDVDLHDFGKFQAVFTGDLSNSP